MPSSSVSMCGAGRRKRCLGSFASETEAAEAYDKAALTLRHDPVLVLMLRLTSVLKLFISYSAALADVLRCCCCCCSSAEAVCYCPSPLPHYCACLTSDLDPEQRPLLVTLSSPGGQSHAQCRGPAAYTNFPADHYASVSTRNEPVNARCGPALKDRHFMGVAWKPEEQQFEARIWTRWIPTTCFTYPVMPLFATQEYIAAAFEHIGN